MAVGGEDEETVWGGSTREEGPASTSLEKMGSESKEKIVKNHFKRDILTDYNHLRLKFRVKYLP